MSNPALDHQLLIEKQKRLEQEAQDRRESIKFDSGQRFRLIPWGY